MESTVFGISILFKFMQLANAPSPIIFSSEDNVISVKYTQG